MTRVLQECVRLNCRGPAGALVVTRPQGVKLLGAEMKIRIRRHCFSAPCANALIEAEDWEGPRFQTCVNAAIVKAFSEISRRRVGQRPLNRGRGGPGFVTINLAYAE